MGECESLVERCEGGLLTVVSEGENTVGIHSISSLLCDHWIYILHCGLYPVDISRG